MSEANGHDVVAGLDIVAERPSTIKAVRDHHHRIARLVAEGRGTGEVAAAVGYSVSRVSILKGDPVFRGLVEYYRERLDRIKDEVFASVYQKAELLRANALDVMNERYEDSPEQITHEMARQDLIVTNEMLEEKVTRSISVHGNLSDMPLAEVVNLRRKRADQLEAASLKALPVGTQASSEAAEGPGSVDTSGSLPISAPTKEKKSKQTTNKQMGMGDECT